VVLGTLPLFAILVVLIHALAVDRMTQPLRLEGLRLLADAVANEVAAGRAPTLPESFGFALIARSGTLVAGRRPPWGFHHGELDGSDGERCAPWGRPCWGLRAIPGRSDGARVIVYRRFASAAGFWGHVSLALLASVLAWFAVSALAGLVLLRSLHRADDSRRRLLAGLAHDLGTPLTSIRGFAETRLSTGEAAADPDRRVWTVVYREALRMQRLIEDMLALTRLEAGRLDVVPRPFDLREALRAAAERAELAHGSGPTLQVPDSPAIATVDRDRIDQVLANLVDNAYRHGGGRNVTVGLERPGAETWRIIVSDEGPGLAPEARAHLYEPFSPWGSGRGSGLGLAIAREIVTRHGGTLRVEECAGCRVVVDLPAAGPRRRSA